MAAHPAPAHAQANTATAETTLSTVTVLGSRDPNVPLSNVPASITVVPREEIAKQQPTAQRIEDILGRTVPGFNPTNVGVRQIRGRTAQVFVNGVPSNEQLRASAGSDLNLLAPDQLEVIEVARGANSAYGFGSPGGVIALSTRRAESKELTLTTRVGTSFNTRAGRQLPVEPLSGCLADRRRLRLSRRRGPAQGRAAARPGRQPRAGLQ
jgi:outer membrane receptor for ferrienterochelin and colicin